MHCLLQQHSQQLALLHQIVLIVFVNVVLLRLLGAGACCGCQLHSVTAL
jgi:hypothetical protein